METWLTPPLVLSALAVIITVVNSYYARKQDKSKETQKQFDEIEQEHEKVVNRVGETEAKLKVIEKQVELFWGTVERRMAKKFGEDE